MTKLKKIIIQADFDELDAIAAFYIKVDVNEANVLSYNFRVYDDKIEVALPALLEEASATMLNFIRKNKRLQN